jgi:bifunctional enzyme CysN/CysC
VSLLRFITCGSVDDGKSTLIGRLLFESKQVYADQLAALAADSRSFGTRGTELDFALLVDGLAAEREQGITIDVAYRYFATARRKYIVADTPGHEQYTRNMATGASTADLAVILVDARKGVLTQTRRHSYISALVGIKHIVLAVNKMDLVGFSRDEFERIAADYREFAAGIGLADVVAIPVVATQGDNVVSRSAHLSWYRGPTLLEQLDSVEVRGPMADSAFRMPVQWVSRPNTDFRGFAGRIEAGAIRCRESVVVQPANRTANVTRIVTGDRDVERAEGGQSVTLVLEPAVDVARGDWIAAADRPAEVASQFEATIIWMGDAPLLSGRAYLLKLATTGAVATVAPLKYKIDVNTQAQQPAERLELNDIGVAEVSLDRAIPFAPYAENRALGGFILIDRLTNDTVGAGLIRFALRRATNVRWQALDTNKAVRAASMGQRPRVVWLTGLSGAGKSTIANLVEKRLVSLGRHTYLLDGDNVRHGLNKDLGFTARDRVENIRRVAEVARLMVDAGLIVLVAFISPFRAERSMARELFAANEFVEVFVDTPLAVAEARDVKGLYRKARAGQLANFTGIDSPYEPPENAEIRIDTTQLTAEDAALAIVRYLVESHA